METTYLIAVRKSYYQGTLGTGAQNYLARDENNEILEYDTLAEAEAAAVAMEDGQYGPYRLAHGEYSAPQYQAREMAELFRAAPKNWGWDYVRERNPGDVVGDHAIIEVAENINVDYNDLLTDLGDEHECWSAIFSHDGAEYLVACFPSTYAVDYHRSKYDDLGDVPWGEPLILALAE